jgi:hypothetical protein
VAAVKDRWDDGGMAEDSDDRRPGADGVSKGLDTGTIVARRKIAARDLTAEHVDRFVTDFDPRVGVKVPAKILKVRHVTEGEEPGVSVLLRLPALRDGTLARNVLLHVPFDHEFQLVEIVGY